MTILQQIKNKIEFLQDKLKYTNLHGQNVYVLIHPETERNIYLNGELSKSEDLGEHLKTTVVLTKEVPPNQIKIGV